MHDVILTHSDIDAYTLADASVEGFRDARPDKTLDGDAVSRTVLDREAAFFCMHPGMTSVSVLIRGGTVIDPGGGVSGRADVRLRDGVVAAVGTLATEPGERAIDADGLVVAPGLVDVHVHLREPGQEWKETIASGSAAAAAGGFTTIFCMPNTEPALDSVAALEELRRRATRDALVHVHPIATITEGRKGRRAVDFEALARAGAVGFSDDGETTQDAAIMRKALEASGQLTVPVMVHCEEPSLIGGAMHEGNISRSLGIKGLPAAAEEIIIGRDLALAELTGGWLHVCHVSTGRGAEMIRAARAQGVRVTAEVMPHHLTMTDAWVAGERTLVNTAKADGPPGPTADPDAKVNPPLRPAGDAKCLLAALRRGVFEVISTDHAPHARHEKQGRSLPMAAFGLTGSELALPLMLTLVRAGALSLSEVISLMSTSPARLWGLDRGTLSVGSRADAVVFDPDEEWVVEPDGLASRGANTPLLGMPMRGRVKHTFVDGVERYCD